MSENDVAQYSKMSLEEISADIWNYLRRGEIGAAIGAGVGWTIDTYLRQKSKKAPIVGFHESYLERSDTE
jgi:hypothetical protein